MASPVLILTGPPGSGKTTVAALLAAASPRGLHIPADVFWTFPAHPVSPYRPEGHEQNADIVVGLTRAAAALAIRGYDVVVDGILGPWFLPTIAAELRRESVGLDYVILTVPLAIALDRVRAREGDGRAHVVRKMHAELSDPKAFGRHVVDAGERAPDAIVAEITARCAAGAFAVGDRS